MANAKDHPNCTARSSTIVLQVVPLLVPLQFVVVQIVVVLLLAAVVESVVVSVVLVVLSPTRTVTSCKVYGSNTLNDSCRIFCTAALSPYAVSGTICTKEYGSHLSLSSPLLF